MKINISIIAIILSIIVVLAPFTWLVVLSFKPEHLIMSDPLTPFTPTLENYLILFTRFEFLTATQYSIIIALLTLAISIPVAALAAYGLSRFPFPKYPWFISFIMFCRTIVPAILVLPLYNVISFLGLRDTVWGIVLGHLTWNLPFNILLLYSFLVEVPRTIEEAAWLDGASRWTTFWKIRFPLMAPAIGVTGLFTFGTSWGEFLFAAAFSTTTVRTGPVQMSLMIGQYKIWWGALAASGVYWSLPMIMASLLFGKYMVKGFRIGIEWR